MFELADVNVDEESIRFACKISEVISNDNNFPSTVPLKDLALGCLCSYALMCRACGVNEGMCKAVADKMLENAFSAMDKFGIQMFSQDADA